MLREAWQEYLTFRVSGLRLGVRMVEIEEVTKLPAQSIMPAVGMPPQLTGLINLRGRVAPVLCAHYLLGGECAVPAGEVTVLLFALQSDIVGFWVDALGDVCTNEGAQLSPYRCETAPLPAAEQAPLPATEQVPEESVAGESGSALSPHARLQRLVHQALLFEDDTLPLLDVQRLLEVGREESAG